MIVSARTANWTFGHDSFADLTGVAVESIRVTREGVVRVTFVGDLPPAEEWAVKSRLLSASPAEEATRTRLASADLSTLDPTVAAVLADLIKLATGESD